MPYNQKKKQLVGYHDGKPISRKYEMQVSNNRQRLLKKETPEERLYRTEVAEFLKHEYGIPYKPQKLFHITDQVAFIADFYFNKFHLAVEIDDPSHNRRKNKIRDEWRSRLLLEKAGVRVIRFTNKEIRTNPYDVLQKTINEMLSQENATPSLKRYLASRTQTSHFRLYN